MSRGEFRVIREEYIYLLTSPAEGKYEFSIGGQHSPLGKERVFYDLTKEELERLANTGVVNLEAELGKINPEATDNFREKRINWEEVSIFLGNCLIEEEEVR